MPYFVVLTVFFAISSWAGDLTQKQQIDLMVQQIFPKSFAPEFEHHVQTQGELSQKKLSERKVKNQAVKQYKAAQKKQMKFFKGLGSREVAQLFQYLRANNNAAAEYHTLLNRLSLTSTYELVKHFLADSLSPLALIIPIGIEVLFIEDTLWLYGNEKDHAVIAKDMNELRERLGKSAETITASAIKQWVYNYYFHHLRAFLATKDPDQRAQLTHILSEIRKTNWHKKRANAGMLIY